MNTSLRTSSDPQLHCTSASIVIQGVRQLSDKIIDRATRKPLTGINRDEPCAVVSVLTLKERSGPWRVSAKQTDERARSQRLWRFR
jgi:hypothetical protein